MTDRTTTPQPEPGICAAPGCGHGSAYHDVKGDGPGCRLCPKYGRQWVHAYQPPTCLGCVGCGGPDCIQRTTEPEPDDDPCAHGCRWAADQATRLGEEMEQDAEPEALEQATEMDPALAEIERLAVELYKAEDTLAWIGELCDIADRTGRAVTTADIRAWLRGPQCARQAYLVITEGPLAEALRAALPDGGA